MSITLGEKLRAARAERGISISEVAEQTRISPLYLEAIDADNYKSLPGGIFNKGFIRSYAKYVGVDEQEALQDYARLSAEGEQQEDDRLRSYRPEVLTDERAVSSIVPTLIFAAVILGLMTAGILLVLRFIQSDEKTSPTIANSTAPASPGTDSGTVAPGAQQPGGAPAMSNLKVAFTAAGDEVWLRSVTDGKSSEALVTPGNTVTFEPKQSLSLRYSKSRAQFAQLALNGKAIALPQQPATPNQANIELNITEANLSQIWQRGEIGLGSDPVLAPTPGAANAVPRTQPRPAATPRSPANTASNTANASPAVPTMTNRPASRPASTPAVVGRPANAERPR